MRGCASSRVVPSFRGWYPLFWGCTLFSRDVPWISGACTLVSGVCPLDSRVSHGGCAEAVPPVSELGTSSGCATHLPFLVIGPWAASGGCAAHFPFLEVGRLPYLRVLQRVRLVGSAALSV